MPDTKRRWLCRGSIPDRVVQILDADGGWLTIDALHMEYQQRFHPIQRTAIDRAVHRVVAAGFVEKRHEEFIDYSVPSRGNMILKQTRLRALRPQLQT